jgi:hypothetical protein
MTQSPGNVAMVTSTTKKIYDDSFIKETLEMNPTIIPFLTAMEVNSRNNNLQHFIAPINHNTIQ